MPKFHLEADIKGAVGFTIEADTLEEALAIPKQKDFDLDEHPNVVGFVTAQGVDFTSVKETKSFRPLLESTFGGTPEENQASMKDLVLFAHNEGILTGLEGELDEDEDE
jgi:hypothetical protein